MSDGCSHLWASVIMHPSRIQESDWCSKCGDPRPGFLDPRHKEWITPHGKPKSRQRRWLGKVTRKLACKKRVSRRSPQ